MRGLACIVLGVAVTAAWGQDSGSLLSQANEAYQAKEYAKCAELYEAAVKAGAAGRSAPYNAACCFALSGKADEAFTWVGKAIEAGWRDAGHMENDSDLASLHDDARWVPIRKRCEEASAAYAKSLKEPELRAELLKRMKEDQRIRLEPNPNMAEWMRIDADNTAYMKTVIDKYGWPGKSMVGDDGALGAFLMVQHADADAAFQETCLPLLTAAAERGEARPQDMAFLTDRVLVARGKPQRYGSQFFSGPDGVLKPRPIEDPEDLDARRKAVGLGPMADYVKQMESLPRNGR